MRSQSAVVSSAALGIVVVVAAGVSGTVHFTGPRWVPHFTITPKKLVPGKTLPTPTKGTPRVPPAHAGSSFPLGQLLLWIVIGLGVIVVAMLLWRWWTHRRRRDSPGQTVVPASAVTEVLVSLAPEPVLDAPAVRTGIERALLALDEQREPADAIVRAWLGLQETAEESGIVRRHDETPTEFTSRIVSRALVDDRAIRTLLRLYLRARFSDHPVTNDDVASVRLALQDLIRTWPAADVTAGAGVR